MQQSLEAKRNSLVKLIHVARRELGMQDEDYRAMLANIPVLEGATSSVGLSVPKLQAILETLKAKGFKVVPKAKKLGQKLADDAQSRLIRHLWLSLADAGKVRDRSETALNKFVEHRTGVAQLAWLSTAQAIQLIEALKQWLNRGGK